MLLYLHIPFCDSKCHYCAFNSYTHLHHLKKSYMQAIMIQIEAEIERFDVTPKSIQTLFIGGGTPSCVEPELYAPFFDFIRPYLQEGAEITSEANPNSATKSWLEGMYQLGVNRISFGVQSFNTEKLQQLNRNHTPQQAKDAIMIAHDIGFKNLSLDLIYGSAFDTKALLLHDMQTAFSLPINHLSAYSLTIEEGTKFFETPEVSKDDETMAYWLVDSIKEAGLPQYEISNFGHYQSQHNLGYWQYQDYLGIGAGAVGFYKDTRFYTHKDVHKYIESPCHREDEVLNTEEMKNEKILLGLRSRVGFDEEILTQQEHQKALTLHKAGKLTYHDKRFFNPNFFLADALTLYITD